MLKCQREKFLLQRKYAYLNCAYMSPMLKKVENAGNKAIAQKRKPYKIKPEHFFKDTETLRVLFSEIIDNDEPKRVIVIPSVSYGMSIIEKNVKPGPRQKIIIAGEQFPSNVYPWKRLEKKYGTKLEVIPAPGEHQNRGKSWNENILKAIDGDTFMVAMGQIHWADGTFFDLKAIREKTLEHGALLVIDGTQSVGAMPFSVKEIKPDALVCSGYKWLMGPYSIGLAYLSNYFDEGEPIEESWMNRLGSENFSNLVNYQDEYQPKALRYEVGEHSNFILVPMLLEAIKVIRHWGIINVGEYCDNLMAEAFEIIKDKGYWIEDKAFRSSHLFGIRLPSDKSIEEVKKNFYINKVSVSIRGNAIRVAPHVYNDLKDINRLLKSLP